MLRILTDAIGEITMLRATLGDVNNGVREELPTGFGVVRDLIVQHLLRYEEDIPF